MQTDDAAKAPNPDQDRPATEDAKEPPGRWDDLPPAGPHDKPELTNHEATPGAGSLPSADADDDIETGSG
jgi:hypothetical protein